MSAASKYERPEHRIGELSRQVKWLRDEITRVTGLLTRPGLEWGQLNALRHQLTTHRSELREILELPELKP